MYQDCKTLNIYYDLTDDPRHLPTTSVATLEINQILEADFLSSSSLFKAMFPDSTNFAFATFLELIAIESLWTTPF